MRNELFLRMHVREFWRFSRLKQEKKRERGGKRLNFLLLQSEKKQAQNILEIH